MYDAVEDLGNIWEKYPFGVGDLGQLSRERYEGHIGCEQESVKIQVPQQAKLPIKAQSLGVAYNDNYFTLKLWAIQGIKIYLNHIYTRGTTVSTGRGSSRDCWNTAQQGGGAAGGGLPKGNWSSHECLDKWLHAWALVPVSLS